MSLIYDWNRIDAPAPPPKVLLADETLRDGLQSASIRTPTIDEKLRILHLIDRLGVDATDIGLPGAGPHVVADVERLAREAIDAKLATFTFCAARTVRADIVPIVDVSLRVGRPLGVAAFIGSSHIRQFVEGWTVDFLQRCTEEAIGFAVKEGLPVMFVTEDTTRAHPETLRCLYSAAVRAGATRLCIADTVGHATPAGTASVVTFVRRVVEECGGGAELDWHGHRDRGFAVLNSLAALDAGATRVHATALGVGERCGNTPMDLLLVNLVLMGYLPSRDLKPLREYCEAVAEAFDVPVPANYPVIGRDAFRTATGVHAAAVVKAYHKNEHALADSVYSSVPASLVGREQEIEVGPMSGRSNVHFWLEKRGIPQNDEIVDRVFARAKDSTTVLTEAEILAIVAEAAAKRRVAE